MSQILPWISPPVVPIYMTTDKLASGAGTDHLEPGPNVTLDDVIRAYEEQCEFVEGAGEPSF